MQKSESMKRPKTIKRISKRLDSKMSTRRMKVVMRSRRSQKLNIKLRQTQETRRCTMKKAKRLLKTKFSESID